MTLKIKQGEPFSVQGQYTEDDGVTPKALTGITLKSQIRTQSGKLIATVEFTDINAAAGTFVMGLPDGESTADWPIETLHYDIKDSTGHISETNAIIVARAQTLI